MHYILCTLQAPLAAVQHQLKNDAAQHAQDGMYLEKVWLNADNKNEVLFLFRVDDLGKARERIHATKAKALAADPKAIFPEMVFLHEAQ